MAQAALSMAAMGKMTFDVDQLRKLNDNELKIWRIVNFQTEEVPKAQHGTFYVGDSYIVLHPYVIPGELKVRHNIYFWLGSETTTDEAGSCAYFSTQLDEALGGVPVQHREPQGEESDAFMKLFPRLQYLQGGAPSGFRRASSRELRPTRLFHINSTGRSHTRMTEVALRRASLRPDDSFVLDSESAVYVYNGPQCNIRERSKAAHVATELRQGRCCKMLMIEPDDTQSEEALAFYSLLAA